MQSNILKCLRLPENISIKNSLLGILKIKRLGYTLSANRAQAGHPTARASTYTHTHTRIRDSNVKYLW